MNRPRVASSDTALRSTRFGPGPGIATIFTCGSRSRGQHLRASRLARDQGQVGDQQQLREVSPLLPVRRPHVTRLAVEEAELLDALVGVVRRTAEPFGGPSDTRRLDCWVSQVRPTRPSGAPPGAARRRGALRPFSPHTPLELAEYHVLDWCARPPAGRGMCSVRRLPSAVVTFRPTRPPASQPVGHRAGGPRLVGTLSAVLPGRLAPSRQPSTRTGRLADRPAFFPSRRTVGRAFRGETPSLAEQGRLLVAHIRKVTIPHGCNSRPANWVVHR